MVLPDGEIAWLGGGVEGGAGFDLLGATCGSEGTFGVVTRAWVRLVPLPEAAHTMLAIFDNFDDAARCVSNVIAAGIIPAALEMLDDVFLPAIEAAYHMGFPLDAAAILLIETDGLQEAAEEECARAAQLCREGGAEKFAWPRTPKSASCCGRRAKGPSGPSAVLRPRT